MAPELWQGHVCLLFSNGYWGQFERSKEAERVACDMAPPCTNSPLTGCPQTLNGPQSKTPFHGSLAADKATLPCSLPYSLSCAWGWHLQRWAAWLADPSPATCTETSKAKDKHHSKGSTHPAKSGWELGPKGSQDISGLPGPVGSASLRRRPLEVRATPKGTKNGKGHIRPSGSPSRWVANMHVSPLPHLPRAAEPNKPRQVATCPSE